jgi:hypothetical protein
VIGLVRSLALETARAGVTVNADLPGLHRYRHGRRQARAITAKTGLSDEQALAELVKDNPQGRLIAPRRSRPPCSISAGRQPIRHRPIDPDQWRGVLSMETPAPSLVLDRETKASERPGDHKDELRLWLRMLTCSTLIETEIRNRLREEFKTTLPRFDLMAQLEKSTTGMTVGEVSQRLMVSNGNVTAVVAGLLADGLVDKRAGRAGPARAGADADGAGPQSLQGDGRAA